MAFPTKAEPKILQPTQSTQKRLCFIDGLRGLAAVWVVLYHAGKGGHIDQLLRWLHPYFRVILFDSGHLGVPIFFALSGFVIAHSLRDVRLDGRKFVRFMLRRSIRLDPPYYISILLVISLGIASSLVKKTPVELPNASSLIIHLFYMQGILQIENINDVYWTLCYEMQFYIAFCVLLMLSQTQHSFNGALFFVPASLASLAWGTGLIHSNLIPGLFTNLWYAFTLGFISNWAFLGRIRYHWFALFAFTILLPSLYQRNSFAVTSVLTSISLCLWADAKVLTSTAIQFLGMISYSLYLTHNPITGAGFFVTKSFGLDTLVGQLVSLIGVLVLCITSALLFWYCIERPCIGLAKHIKI